MVKTYLKVFIPNAIKDKYKLYRAQKRFQRISTQKYTTDALIHSDALCLKEIFLCGISEEWQNVQNRMSSLPIPLGTGGVNPGDRRAIYYLVRFFQPERVLEIGTHIGASTLHIALAQKQYLSDHDRVQLVSVDIHDVNDVEKKHWIPFGTRMSPLEMIQGLGAEEIVQFVCSDSLTYLRHTEMKFDFIFLDGSHDADVVYQEIPASLNVLKSNGVILLHDYFPDLKPLWSNKKVIPGPFLAVQRLISEGARIEAIPLGQLPWPTKLGSQVTSLALLVKKR